MLAALGPWAWIILGIVLIGAELLAPGNVLIWLGVAALGTGLVDGFLGLSWQTAFIVYGVLAIGSVFAGRRLMGGRMSGAGAEPFLNRRGDALVGRTFRLSEPLAGGEGRIHVDDSVWRVIGPDLPEGVQVRVLRVEGATLVVEAAPT
jgi:membrane protein implicated in regulation of membrane protease activity